MPRQSQERRSHWVGLNHQNRIPGRWIAFDTEARKEKASWGETQMWRMGAAKMWRTDTAVKHETEVEFFHTPLEMWEWITRQCRPKTRTVVWAHNLSYDIRISQLMDILPQLGWHMDWCNLGAQVSTMTWRSEHGTLTFADSTSWLPMPLKDIGPLVGLPKLKMPPDSESVAVWKRYLRRDVEILFRAVDEIVSFVRSEDLGNWQPTGAGMAFATWRHKFLDHKVLVHDDEDAIRAERQAMHTGRAEAWRHGKLRGDTWCEVDLKQAYVHIAKGYELPIKLKFHNGAITLGQYHQLRRTFCVLGRVTVRTSVPSVPVYIGGRTVWPAGEFTTWLWDPELDAALQTADSVSIREVYVYTRAPVLARWADWVLKTQERDDECATPVVRKWIKHSGRTLIGRIALRTAQWAVWGANPDREAGISYEVDADTGRVYRLMHAGDRTFREESRVEGHDSLPQITGYIMSVCRVWLWEAIHTAGDHNIAHVDTDCVIVNGEGLGRMRRHYADRFDTMWQIKATYRTMEVFGPRNYRGSGARKVAGVPSGAVECAPNKFRGEQWSSLAGDLSRSRNGTVTIRATEWNLEGKDPRRLSLPGVTTYTTPVVVNQTSKVSSPVSDAGASGS